MVLPLIFGKIGKDVLDGEITTGLENGSTLIIGFFAALISGYFACKWMISIVRKSKLVYFSIYCFVVGLIAIGFGFFG